MRDPLRYLPFGLVPSSRLLAHQPSLERCGATVVGVARFATTSEQRVEPDEGQNQALYRALLGPSRI